MLHCTEESWRARFQKRRVAKLHQQIYLRAKYTTFKTIEPKNFGSYPLCTNKGDVIGPVVMDPIATLPNMTTADMVAFYGKRRVGASGAQDDSSGDSSASECEGGEGENEDNDFLISIF